MRSRYGEINLNWISRCNRGLCLNEQYYYYNNYIVSSMIEDFTLVHGTNMEVGIVTESSKSTDLSSIIWHLPVILISRWVSKYSVWRYRYKYDEESKETLSAWKKNKKWLYLSRNIRFYTRVVKIISICRFFWNLKYGSQNPISFYKPGLWNLKH